MYSLEEQLLLFFSSLAIGGLFILGLQLIKMFINSKPPGRRMVNVDINCQAQVQVQVGWRSGEGQVRVRKVRVRSESG